MRAAARGGGDGRALGARGTRPRCGSRFPYGMRPAPANNPPGGLGSSRLDAARPVC